MDVEGNAPPLTFVVQLESTVLERSELGLLPELGFLPLVPELPGKECGLLLPAGGVSKLRRVSMAGICSMRSAFPHCHLSLLSTPNASQPSNCGRRTCSPFPLCRFPSPPTPTSPQCRSQTPTHSDSPFLQIRHTRINKLMITLDLRHKVLLLPRRVLIRLGHGREVLSLQLAEVVLLPYIRGDGDEQSLEVILARDPACPFELHAEFNRAGFHLVERKTVMCRSSALNSGVVRASTEEV